MNTTKLGILSALTASACCLGPAALVAVGLGGLGVGAYFLRYAGVLIGIAALLLFLGWWGYLREARRCATGHCRMPGRQATFVTLSLASVIVAAFALTHVGPLAAKAVACAVSCPR